MWWSWYPSKGVLKAYATILLFIIGGTYIVSQQLKSTSHLMSDILYGDLDFSENYENYSIESPLHLVSSTSEFQKAPLRISVISDFDCPMCKTFSQMLPALEKHYRGKINIRYFFPS